MYENLQKIAMEICSPTLPLATLPEAVAFLQMVYHHTSWWPSHK